MPRKRFVGPDVPRLMAQVQSEMGQDAVVLSVRRLGGGRFELTADDALAAAADHALRRARRTPAPVSARPLPGGGAAAPSREWPAPGHPGSKDGPHVVALVGPTGAGKTTTLAKLANHPDAFGGRRVGLLCLDTYRVGAVEQSRIYAELSRLPFVAVHEAADAARAMRRLRGCDVVLVDTAGRGPAARQDLDETCETLARLGPHEIHVVLPAGLREELAMRVVGDWRDRGATHVLPTKLDECPDDHVPFDAAMRYRMRVRWLTDGQEVPADLRSAALSVVASARRRREPETAGVA